MALSKEARRPELMVDGLGDLWYNGARFAPEGNGSWYGWGISGGNLARINVEP